MCYDSPHFFLWRTSMSWFSNRGRHRARGGTSFAVLSGFCAAFFVWVLVGSLSPPMQAGQSRTVRDGVYSAAQATRGQALFKQQCVLCHAETLKGGLGPPLVGDDFLKVWGNQPLSDLVNKI